MKDKKMVGSLNARTKGTLLGGLLLFLFALSSSTAHAQAKAGDLDPSFGSGGKVYAPTELVPEQIRIQPDGKIVTISTYTWDALAAISRHNPDGTLDLTFGGSGYLLFEATFMDFVIQPDGKIVIVGISHEGRIAYALFRLNSDGSADTTFGTQGTLLPPIPGNSMASAIALQPDGKIVTTGFMWESHVIVTRHFPDGSLDPGFGKGGIISEPGEGYPNHLVIQADEKLAIGVDRCDRTSCSAFVIRYQPQGNRDLSFGTNGHMALQMPSLGGLVQQSDGKLIVNASNGSRGSLLKRLNVDGTLDLSFGQAGIVLGVQNENFYGQGLGIDSRGRILSTGRHNGAFAISRYDPSGSPDLGFGQDGLALTPMDNAYEMNSLYAIAFQEDGKVVAAGYYRNGKEGFTTLVRYLADAPAAGRQVSGRIIGPDGRGLRSATVTITDAHGQMRSATTSSLGFYSFSDLIEGDYVLRARSKQYRFATLPIRLSSNVNGADMVGFE